MPQNNDIAGMMASLTLLSDSTSHGTAGAASLFSETKAASERVKEKYIQEQALPPANVQAPARQDTLELVEMLRARCMNQSGAAVGCGTLIGTMGGHSSKGLADLQRSE